MIRKKKVKSVVKHEDPLELDEYIDHERDIIIESTQKGK